MAYPSLTVVWPPNPICPCRCYRRNVEIEAGHPIPGPRTCRNDNIAISCVDKSRNGLRSLEKTSELG